MMPDYSKLSDEELDAIIEGKMTEASARPAGTNPATGQPLTTADVKEALFGGPTRASEIEPSTTKRALAGAGRALEQKWRGLTGQEEAPGYGLEEDPAARFGSIIPEAVGSMVAPARILPQMAFGAASRAAEPAPNLLERGIAGTKGAAEFGVGQGLASGLVRVANATTGALTREGEAAAAARGAGLDLTAGDISGSKLLKLAEEKSFGSPSGGQAEQIAKLMTQEGGDPITLSVQTAYQNAQSRVADAARKLDDIIASNPNIPKVTPRQTYEALQQIAKRSPDTLNNVRDPELRAMLEEMISAPAGRIPKGMDFSSLDELRKVLGPVMAKVELQSQSGASNITTADANRWKKLYKGIMGDIDAWGSKAATADALAAHKELSSTFKNEVLPLREHPVAGKIIEGRYERPEDLVRDITSPRNKSIVNDLYGRLDDAGKNVFDAFRMATRGTKEFVRGEPSASWARPLTLGGAGALGVGAGMGMGGALTSALPWLGGALAAEQALVRGLNTPVGRAVASGSPQAARSPLANAAIYAGLRSTIPHGALESLRDRRGR